jgi:hypothetical protein
MENLLTHATEHNLGMLELICVTGSDHEGEGSVGGSHDSSAHWRITVDHAMLLGLFTKLFGRDGRDGGAVHDASALVGGGKDTFVLHEDLLNVLSARQTSDDVVDIATDLSDGLNWLDAKSLSLLEGGIIGVKTFNLESIFLKVGCHVETHVAHADETHSLCTGY